jgi:hypothetical protein
MKSIKKRWNYIETEVAEENPEKYFVVFEESVDRFGKDKYYDLTQGIFANFEEAKAFADAIKNDEPMFVAN